MINYKDVQPLPSVFERLPFQAIECSLVDVACVDQEWDETFERLVTIGEKLLHAEVSIVVARNCEFGNYCIIWRFKDTIFII